MNTNTVICVMIGLPGAGKSTVTQKLKSSVKQFAHFAIKITTFSFDDFLLLEEQEKMVLLSKNNFDHTLFKEERNKFVENIENVVKNIQSETECLKNIIIVDDNFYYKSMRYRFFQMASKYYCGYCQVYINCDVELALERNINRFKFVKEEVIRTMSDRMEPPSLTNSWEKQSITVESDNIDEEFSNICDIIIKNFSNGLCTINLSSIEKAEARVLNLKNLIHRADLVLRTLVGEQLKVCQEEHGHTKKDVAVVANAARQNLLSKIKAKNLQIPNTVFDEDNINVEELMEFLRIEFENCLM